MSTVLDIIKNIGIFLLIGSIGFITFVVFGYLTNLLQSVYSWFGILGASCSDIEIVGTMTSSFILFLLISFVYRTWLK